MNKITTCLFVFLSVQSFATTWQIEAGGGPGMATPYFDPQFIEIMQGDVVNWTWATGIHNVLSTSGPEMFDSDSHQAPFQWSFTFDMAGEYDFICSLFDHEDTQFGTITVLPLSVEDHTPVAALDFSLSPNPASHSFILEKNYVMETDITITDLNGKVLSAEKNVADLRRRYDVSDFPSGIYFVELFSNGYVVRKRLMVK